MNRSIISLLAIVILITPLVFAIEPTLAVTSVNSPKDNYWITKTPIQQARGGLGVVSVEDKIYAIGGALNCVRNSKASTWKIVNTTEEYNPQTDSWTTKNSMPTARVYFATVAYQNKIYCFGGLIGTTKAPYMDTEILLPVSQWCNTSEVYDPLTDKWETKTPMPLTPDVQLTATVFDDKIFLIGDIGAQPLMVYNPATNQWNTTVSQSESIKQSWNKALIHAYATTGASTGDAQFTATTYNNNLYVFARGLFLSSTNAGFIYNSLNQSWTLGKPAPSEITGALAVTTSGVLAPKLIYCESSTANYVYDPKNDSWQIGERLHTNRFDFGVAISNDKIYVVGGYSSDDLLSGVATTEEYVPLGYGNPEPSPSVPELSWLAGVPLLLSVSAVALIVRHQKTAK